MRIPQSTDAGPSLGGGGLLSVREQVGYAEEGIQADLAAGHAAGDAIRGLGKDLTHAGAILRDEEMRLAAQEESTNAAIALAQRDGEIQDDVRNDPSIPPAEMHRAYLDRMAQSFEEIQGGLQFEDSKLALAQHGLSLAQHGNASLRADGTQRLAQGGLAQLDTLREEALRRVQKGDEDGADTISAEFNQRLGSLAGVIPENVLVNQRQAFDAQTSAARFDGLLAADPSGALASRMVKDHPEAFPNADLTKMAETAKIAGREGRRSGLFDRWDSGLGKVADLDRAVANRDLTAVERRKLLKDREKAVAAGIEDQNWRRYFDGVAGGALSPLPTDKDYQKYAETYWKDVYGSKLKDLPIEQQYGEAAKFAAKFAVVPQQVLAPTKGDLATYGPGALRAAEFVTTLRAIAPGMLNSYSKPEQAAAAAVAALIPAGPQEAVARAKDLASVAKGTQTEIKVAIKEQFARHSFEDFARAHIVKDAGLFGWTPGPLGSRPEIPPSVLGQMRDAYEYGYLATGSQEAAEKMMTQVPASTWGYSHIAGPGGVVAGPAGRLMEYAPEKLYSRPGYGSEEMRQDLLVELVKPAVTGPSSPIAASHPELAKLSDAELLARTWIDADTYTAQSPPGQQDYGISVMTDQGPVPIGRWRPNTPGPGGEETSPTLLKQQGETVDSARSKAASWRLLRALPEMILQRGDQVFAQPQDLDSVLAALHQLESAAPVGPEATDWQGNDPGTRARREILLDELARSGIKLPRKALEDLMSGEFGR